MTTGAGSGRERVRRDAVNPSLEARNPAIQAGYALWTRSHPLQTIPRRLA